MTEVMNSSLMEFGLAQNSSKFWIHMGERYVVASRKEAGLKEISQIKTKQPKQTNKKAISCQRAS